MDSWKYLNQKEKRRVIQMIFAMALYIGMAIIGILVVLHLIGVF